MRMSQAMAMASPAPTAGPGSAAIVGLRTDTSAPVSRRCCSWRSATLSSKDISSFFGSRCAPMPLTLPPAQNASPAPVISSAPTSGLSPQVRIIVRSAGVSASDSELRTSGRFSVITATRSRITQRSSLMPVSMVVSVVMPLPLFRHCEARSDEAIQPFSVAAFLDCFASLAMTVVVNLSSSKLLHPGPQLQLPAPGAARLLQHVPVALRDGIGIEHRIRLLRRFRARYAPDAAIDHEMRDMDALRRQFARHALRQPAQCEFAHRERCGLRIALDAGRSAGEQDRAVLVRQHAPGRLLPHQEAAIGTDRNGVRHVGRNEIDERPARAAAGVVDDQVGRADLAFDQAEQALDLIRVCGVAGIGLGPSLAAERAELLDFSSGQCDADALGGQ